MWNLGSLYKRESPFTSIQQKMFQFNIEVLKRDQVIYSLDQENRSLVREENKRREGTHPWLYRKLTGGQVIVDGFFVSVILFIALCLTVPDSHREYRIIIPWVVWSLVIISYFAFRGKYGEVSSMNHLGTTTYFRSVDDLIDEWNIGLLETYIINFLRAIEPRDEKLSNVIAVKSFGRFNLLVIVDPEDDRIYYLSEMISK